MIRKKSLPAFTVIELLIAMLLGAIVIGLAYLYFAQLQNFLANTYAKESDYSDLNHVQFVMENDFVKAITIIAPGNGSRMLIDIGEDKIEYAIDDESIIRESANGRDIFNVSVESFSFQKMENYNNLIQSVEIEFLPEKDKSITFLCYKEYPAQTLFRIYQKAKNGY